MQRCPCELFTSCCSRQQACLFRVFVYLFSVVDLNRCTVVVYEAVCARLLCLYGGNGDD